MADAERYYLDTNALLKHYVDGQGSLVVRRLSSTATVYVSNLTYLELVTVLMRHLRQGYLKRKVLRGVMERLQQDIGAHARHRFQLVPTQDGVFRHARALVLDHADRCELSTNDALHIAIARLMQPPVILVTSDGGKSRGSNPAKMKCVCERIGLTVLDPEQPQPVSK